MAANQKPRKAPAKKTAAKNKGGRPSKLQPDDKTIKQIETLSGISCTKADAAAVLGVCRETFEKFLGTHKKASDAWEQGKGLGRVSLRRMQWETAKRSVTMQIWLGKQMLGQTDKVEEKVEANVTNEHRIIIDDAAALFDARLDQYVTRVSAAASGGDTEDASRTTH